MERRVGRDAHIEVTKSAGTIEIEGFDVDQAITMRRRLERVFDVQAVLKVVKEDETVICLTGPSNGPLPEDVTADGFRMWISGWFEGRRPERTPKRRGGMARS